MKGRLIKNLIKKGNKGDEKINWKVSLVEQVKKIVKQKERKLLNEDEYSNDILAFMKLSQCQK